MYYVADMLQPFLISQAREADSFTARPSYKNRDFLRHSEKRETECGCISTSNRTLYFRMIWLLDLELPLS
jgi:hypothetical protein